MTDLAWVIGIDRSDGGIVSNGIEGDVPDISRGEQVTLPFLFWNEPIGTRRTGLTFGNSNGGTFGGSSGGTFGSRDTAGFYIRRYLEARKYLTESGPTAVGEGADGKPYVTETLPSGADVDSLVVGIKPGADYTGAQGFWGVVVGGDDPTRLPADICQLDLTFTVLAELNEFATRSDLTSAREVSIA